MSQNKIGVSRKMSIEYPYKQLPCQTQGRLPSNGPIRSDPALKILLRPWSFLRRVTPDRVLALVWSDVRTPPLDRLLNIRSDRLTTNNSVSVRCTQTELSQAPWFVRWLR